MSEEFKAIRITLSEEARDRLAIIIGMAAFRSNSAAIEECIRVVYEIMRDIWVVLGEKDGPYKAFDVADAALTFNTIATRMTRFTGRVLVTKPPKK